MNIFTTVVFGYKDTVYMDKTTEIWPFLAIFEKFARIYGQNNTL